MKLSNFFVSLALIAATASAIPLLNKRLDQSTLLSNGQQAQQKNKDFSQLTPSSSCTEGTSACVNQQFAQCVGGKFTLTACSPNTICLALPLVNEAGTTITCTTEDDGEARIAATGATGGITGGDSGSGSGSGSGTAPSATTSAEAAPSASESASSTSSGDDFHLKNGQDAQKLNAKFKDLTADSSCNEGDQACINGGFAQCVGGKFSITQCAGGTVCAALPLVNKPGTSITCTTQDDAASRIANTGATGGIDGSS